MTEGGAGMYSDGSTKLEIEQEQKIFELQRTIGELSQATIVAGEQAYILREVVRDIGNFCRGCAATNTEATGAELSERILKKVEYAMERSALPVMPSRLAELETENEATKKLLVKRTFKLDKTAKENAVLRLALEKIRGGVICGYCDDYTVRAGDEPGEQRVFCYRTDKATQRDATCANWEARNNWAAIAHEALKETSPESLDRVQGLVDGLREIRDEYPAARGCAKRWLSKWEGEDNV